MSEALTDWREEGKKAFVHTMLHPAKPQPRYPTQDVHTPQQERDYIDGFNGAKVAWQRGEQLSGMEAYASELDEVAPLIVA